MLTRLSGIGLQSAKLRKRFRRALELSGKYHPPNGERPLYLHISAASHLETTAERIKAVDHAAAMVDEMLKQPNANNGVKVDHLLSTCIFLGFEVDPSVNIAPRIRGPNDQYVNHIMNETGATVSLRGQRSGFAENGQCEETQQPLHLFLSSNDAKLLERAKLLAENLLDTICAEFGSSRISSCKVYGAVPPPPQLQAGVNSPGNASKLNNIPAFTATTSGLSIVASQGSVSQSGLPNSALPQTNTCYPHGLTSGTSYIGYGGIYPQATPLQQVALALKHTTSPELPVAAKGHASINQVFSLTFYEAYRQILDLYIGDLHVSQGAKLTWHVILYAVPLHLSGAGRDSAYWLISIYGI
ncbi:hypothetical protein SASPL_139844 [Salvia splendens]|uniref:Protein RIK n=1 Tax=Salvia splendens TaxID=180675 RepID=A0A8X8WMR8_SALSN|nr:hypothetical protein SASPL_139844 [Salvia splendens]